jgi:small ligand-binding sensory domain FIST
LLLIDRGALTISNRYNTVFYNLAQVSLGSQGVGAGMFSGGGRGRLVYPGPTTDLEFINGTKISITNTAKVLVDFTDIKTGEDL